MSRQISPVVVNSITRIRLEYLLFERDTTQTYHLAQRDPRDRPPRLSLLGTVLVSVRHHTVNSYARVKLFFFLLTLREAISSRACATAAMKFPYTVCTSRTYSLIHRLTLHWERCAAQSPHAPFRSCSCRAPHCLCVLPVVIRDPSAHTTSALDGFGALPLLLCPVLCLSW
ncbi:hypothetical protein SLA2020_096250 [Shorea laevis]